MLTHASVATLAAISSGLITYVVVTGRTEILALATAHAQNAGLKNTEVMNQALPDVGRVIHLTLSERDPGSSSPLHRHQGHSFGFIVKGTSEVKIGDEPVRQLKAGDAYYDPPGVLHMVRNPSPDKQLKYLQIEIAQPK